METLRVDRAAGVVTVTLDRPRRLNAANATMWRELTVVLDEVAATDTDRVMVLTGAGEAFCSGADLSADADPFADGPALSAMRRVGEAALRLVRLPKPTIARVNGVAAGAGANMALACDLVIASESARFCQIFARRGMTVDFGGSWLLPRLVGLHKAKELALLADMLSASEAAEIGLVNRVVPDGELDAAVADWATRLAAGPPLALSLTKSLLNDGFAMSVEQAVEAEAMAQAHNFGTKDIVEAMLAWREKRSPKFTGR